MAAETQALHHGLRLDQRYQLTERLERGALATVYRGQDLVLRRPIAVKAVPADHIAAYQASLRESAQLAHPAAICVYDALEYDGWLFVVQEYVVARPISAYFRQGVPTARAVDLARQMASALAYAHMRGIIHGDLTPTAVLVDRNATVRLNNFGLPQDTGYFARVASAVAASLAADDPTVEAPAAGEDTVQIEDRPDPTAARVALASPAGDARAIGYLLWLLLTEPVLAADGVEQADGIRRFRGEVPRALRELVTHTVTEGAPLANAEPQTRATGLALALERIGSELAAVPSTRPSTGRASGLLSGRGSSAALATPPAVLAARAAARETSWSSSDTVQGGRQPWGSSRPPGVSHGRTAGESAPPLPPRLAVPATARPSPSPPAPAFDGRGGRRGEGRGDGRRAPARADLPADIPIWGGGATRTNDREGQRGSVPLVGVLLLCAVLFVLFFLVGYFSTSFFH